MTRRPGPSRMDAAEMRRDMKKEGAMCQFGLCGNPHAPHTVDGKKVCSDHYDLLTDEDEDVEFRSLRDTLDKIFPDRDSPDHPFNSGEDGSDPSDPHTSDAEDTDTDMFPNPPDEDDVPDDTTDHKEISLWRNYRQGMVGVQVEGKPPKLLTPDAARDMAQKMDDNFGDDAPDDLISDLQQFADEVEDAGGDDSA